MSESVVDRLRQQIQLNTGYQESGACVLPVSLEGFWTHFLADGSKLNWVSFWLEAMQGKETMATEWSPNEIPNQGKQYSRQEDNFKICYPGQNASLMRCIGATLPIKGVPMVSEAKIKKFQAIFERT